ncbi:MAG: HD domain-containing protein [Patescibacteria group bacterium]
MRLLELKFIKHFTEEFPKANIYLVGGAIRDFFLNRETNDFDFVSEGISAEELEQFLEKEGTVVGVEGRSFGVFKFKPFICHSRLDLESRKELDPRIPFSSKIAGSEDDTIKKSNETIEQLKNGSCPSIDIALPRREEYLVGGRRKNAEVLHENVSIIDDLARRDFTINAMAVDLRQIGKSKDFYFKLSALNLNLIDPFDGLSDLKNKIIRAVGSPSDRFQEDPTRILRGIRFAAQFGLTVETETFLTMQKLAFEVTKKFKDVQGREVERVSFEVIGQEFLKTMGADPLRALECYDETGLLKILFPEVFAMKGVEQPPEFHSEGDVFTHTRLALQALPHDASLRVKLAVLFHDIGKVDTFTPVSVTGDRIRFNDHDRIGAEKAKEILHRLKLPKRMIDDVYWLIKNHMRLPFAFPRMKLDKQKAFVREPLFDDLITLVCADAQASFYPDGKQNDCSFLAPVRQIQEMVKREIASGKPVEIINGREIIQILKTVRPGFDPEKQGRLVGAIKKKINSMYDRNEIRSKDEARHLVSIYPFRKHK